MQVRRVPALVRRHRLCRVARASRSATTTTRPQRAAHRNSRTSRRSSAVDSTLSDAGSDHGARRRPLRLPQRDRPQPALPTRTIAITWESNHFIRGQSGDHLHSVHARCRSGERCRRGAALYIRVVDANRRGVAAASPRRRRARQQQESAAAVAADVRLGQRQFRRRSRRRQDVARDCAHARRVRAVHRASRRRRGAAGESANDRNRNAVAATALPEDRSAASRAHGPGLQQPELTTSSVILARSVEPLARRCAGRSRRRTRTCSARCGSCPSPDGKFAKAGELQVHLLDLRRAAAAAGKPDVTVEFNFHQKAGRGRRSTSTRRRRRS